MKKKKNFNPIYKLQSSDLWKKGFNKIFYSAFRKIFFFFQKFGIHVIPNHYYCPVPDTRTLTDYIFHRKTQLIGINVNEREQLELLNSFEINFKREYEKIPRLKTKIQYQYYTTSPNFKSVDAEILYCMIRHFKPKKIIEIGAGSSTFCSAQAILKNKEEESKYNCDLVSIEPFPNKIFKLRFPGFTRLIPKEVQKVPISEFKKLQDNDILFIDSSHVLKMGGDVQYEILEVLPRLNKGVIIHIHDILLPAEYPKDYPFKYFRFWTEQYLLQAFLAFNNNFKILWMSKYMHLNHPEKLEQAFYSLKLDRIELSKTELNLSKKDSPIPNAWPCSFWMKKIN